MLRILAAAIVCTALWPLNIQAQQLLMGASQGEVLSILGAPKERVEQEVKRRAIWHYGNNRQITFAENKLIQDSHNVSLVTEARQKLKNSNTPTTLEESLPMNSKLSFTGTDVFREIGKIEPSDDSSSEKTKKRSGLGSRKR